MIWNLDFTLKTREKYQKNLKQDNDMLRTNLSGKAKQNQKTTKCLVFQRIII